MRMFALAAVLLGVSAFSARATPPDMICEVSDGPLSFTIILVTNYSNLNRHSIIPLALHHSSLTITPPVANLMPSKISLYSKDIAGQWLMDGRVDLQLYKQEKLDNGRTYSVNLLIKTKSTGKQSEESGHLIHKGIYQLQLFSGSMRDNDGKLIKQFSGDVICD